jgi:hypothetical protein
LQLLNQKYLSQNKIQEIFVQIFLYMPASKYTTIHICALKTVA